MRMAKNRHFLGYLKVNGGANRGICCIFLTFQKRDEPPVSRRPDLTHFGIDFQLSEATRLDRRENFREAVFLWITPRETPLAISG